MGEIIKDFESQKVAGSGNIGIPGEDGAVDDFDVVGVASRRRCTGELGGLQGSEIGRDFNNFEFCAVVDARVEVADVVEDVEHEGPISRAHFVYDEVVVGVVRELVVCDEVSGNGFTIVGAEELGGSVPHLTGVVWVFGIEGIFEGGIALAEEGVEVGFVGHRVEVKGLAGGEDDDLFGEVAIVRIVQAI